MLEPIGWTDRPTALRWFFRSFYLLCLILAFVEFVVSRHSSHPHPWEHALLFYPTAGFVSFWGLVIVARGMRRLLIREERYYDPADDRDDPDADAPAGRSHAD